MNDRMRACVHLISTCHCNVINNRRVRLLVTAAQGSGTVHVVSSQCRASPGVAAVCRLNVVFGVTVGVATVPAWLVN